MIITLGSDNSYVGEITKSLVEVQAVANNKFIGNFKPQIVDRDIKFPLGWFREKGTEADGGGLLQL